MSDYIQSVVKAVHIMELFDNNKNREIGIVDIKNKLGFPISTAHRLVSTLEHVGLLTQNPATSKYSLGFKAYSIGTKVKVISQLRRVATPYLQDLANKYVETINLVVASDRKVLSIKRIDTARKLAAVPIEGETQALHVTSCGKCLLAFDAFDGVDDYIENADYKKITNYTIDNKEDLRLEVEKVRREKFAVDREETEIGLTCFGVPVLSSEGKAICAISISIPNSRLIFDIDELKKDLQYTARKISAELE